VVRLADDQELALEALEDHGSYLPGDRIHHASWSPSATADPTRRPVG
jgi:hypothetical protein